MEHRKSIRCLILLSAFLAAGAQAQSTGDQQSAIQDQITQGIDSGNLSAEQIAALQARQQQLATTGTAAQAIQQGSFAQPGLLSGENPRPLAGNPGANALNTNPNAMQPVPNTVRPSTGPDPFTYNILGPDAYQAQKYQNPGYNVPAYPTTQPQAEGTQQLTNGPSAGTPYGSGYAQAPGAGGALPQVYVYQPRSTK